MRTRLLGGDELARKWYLTVEKVERSLFHGLEMYLRTTSLLNVSSSSANVGYERTSGVLSMG